MKNSEVKNIQAIKTGNVVHVSLNGKLHKKNCGSVKEADELFKLVLKAKADPSEDNVRAIRCYLNEKTRIAYLVGLESDVESGEVFLAGFNTPIPMTLVDVIKDYYDNGYPLDAIINFWKLLMINPDTRVRKSLFDFIKTHDFVLTDKGYMIVYKAVYYKDLDKKSKVSQKKTELAEFVSNQYFHVKKDWNCSPNKYVVYRDLESGVEAITKVPTAVGWGWNSVRNDEQTFTELNVQVLGRLGDIYNNIFDNGEADETSEDVPVYTDMYTRKMTIVLGKPVQKLRSECDGDPLVECSYGLHAGATQYVEIHGSSVVGGRGVILACYVNPANVVAVPAHDHSKFRTTEYFPFAIASYVDGKIDIADQPYFESDYQSYETEELEKQVAQVIAGEKPLPKAFNAPEEERPMSELQKMLETRLIDLK
jgi:hypothetical protein